MVFAEWEDPAPLIEHTLMVEGVEDYVPGQFYRREMPCLLQLISRALARHPQSAPPIDTLIVDGFVFLGDKWGLGRHLLENVGQTGLVCPAIVGVAKTRFKNADAEEVLRGDSARPLYITAAGMSPRLAAARVRSMAGPHRIPALLKRVDQLARGA